METIKIEFQPNIKEKLMEFLNSFKKNDLHIVEEDNTIIKDDAYWEYRNRLHSEVEKVKSGESKLHSFDELDEYLDNIISKYEN